jgi:hypothetical protein
MIGSDELLATEQHVRLESSAFLRLLCRRSLCRSLSCGLLSSGLLGSRLLGSRLLSGGLLGCRLFGGGLLSGGLLAVSRRLSLWFSRLSSCCSAQYIPHSACSCCGGQRGSWTSWGCCFSASLKLPASSVINHAYIGSFGIWYCTVEDDSVQACITA